MSNKTMRARARLWMLTAILSTLAATWLFWHKPIDRAVSVPVLLHSECPEQDWLFDLADQFSDPTQFLQRCWDTGKVVHRQLVAAYLKQRAVTRTPWLAEASGLLVEGARDGDMSVRELALGTMERLDDPRLIDCAENQLSDPDPLVRNLGLEYLRKAEPSRGVPLVMPLLEDADPRVVARAEVALARWTKQDFGARVFLAIPPAGQSEAQTPSAENLDKLRQAVERRKEWWQLHSKEFETNASPPRVAQLTVPLRPPLTDFSLRDLDGRLVRLSDFKGRPVLLNFWATWCTACLAEMPELIALRKKLGDRVAIIGVALDGVTDEDGHTPGHEEGEAHQEARSLSEIRKQVLRAVKRRNLDYTVVMDPDYSIGARFNGGELPTTVIIDASGRVRRRFIGERSREVFEAMIAEAERP